MALGKLFGFGFSHRPFCCSLRCQCCHHLLCARLNLRKILLRLRRVRALSLRTPPMTQFTGATVATLSTPGVEPGLSRPQRDVLTTRRCGRCKYSHGHIFIWRYEITITNTSVATDSEILGTLTTLKFGCRPCGVWSVLDVEGTLTAFKAVPCRAVPCRAVLRCAALLCAALRCAALRCAVLCNAALCCAALRCAALCCALQCCAVLRNAVQCCAVLCCAVPCRDQRGSASDWEEVQARIPACAF